MKEEPMSLYLRATDIIDSDNIAIRQKAKEVSEPYETDIEKAIAIFYFVRDQIKYNPFMPRFLPEHFRASNTLERKTGFCIQKAVLLAALSRAVRIPSRLRFAVLKNQDFCKTITSRLFVSSRSLFMFFLSHRAAV